MSDGALLGQSRDQWPVCPHLKQASVEAVAPTLPILGGEL